MTAPARPQPSRRLARLAVRGGIGAVVFAAAVAACCAVRSAQSERRLQAVVADLDAAGPWRLADLHAARAPSPVDLDVAPVAGVETTVTDWERHVYEQPGPLATLRATDDLPQLALTPAGAEALAEQVADIGAVWALWPDLLGRSYARFAIGFGPFSDTRWGLRQLGDDGPDRFIHVGCVTRAATAFAWFFADARHPREATAAVRGAIRAASLLGDDLDGATQLSRWEHVAAAGRTLERVLGQCEPAADLDAIATQLEIEAARPVWRRVLLGDRAQLSATLTGVQERSTTLRGYEYRSGWRALTGELGDRTGREVRPLHADMLLAYTEALAHAYEPMHTQASRVAGLQAKLNASLKAAGVDGWFTDEMEHRFERLRLCHARIACARVVLAAERHRLRTGAYPAAVPDLPRSPFSGHPLRYALTPTGAVVSDPAATTARVEEAAPVRFAMFLPPHRHQPPPPRATP